MRRFGFGGLVLIAALAACSPGGGASSSTASTASSTETSVSSAAGTATTAPSVVVADAGSGHDACHGDLTGADVAPLLGAATITVHVDAANPEKCSFSGDNNTSVTVLLARGDKVQAAWDAAMHANPTGMDVVIGVGEAGQHKSDGSLLIARKGALYCQIDVGGLATVIAQPGVHDADHLTQQTAALCAKVFDAEHA